MHVVNRLRFIPAAVMAGLILCVGCNPIEPGIWEINGSDSLHGSFVGSLEIRAAAHGGREAIRLVRLVDEKYTDGRTIELAWTGTVETDLTQQSLMKFNLVRADFVPKVGALVRTEAERDPLLMTAPVSESGSRGLDLTYTTDEDPGWSIEEHGVFVGAPGADPMFKADREVHATHPEPGPILKGLLFNLFGSYHALPEVLPYVDDPLFKKAVHYQVVERTDFEYYRSNPDRIRVVNKIVDAISLAETEIRANAFRTRFNEKASSYQDGVTHRFLGSHGMVENRDGDGNPRPDGDGALWTGVYGYTQALRYRATAEPQALEDLRAVVAGMHTLMDITGDPRNFARTVRLTGPPLGDNWRRGEGPFAHLDWLVGGNNDMAHGLLLGMIAGWDALPADDPLRPEIASHARALLDLCEFMQERAPECPARDGLPLPSINPGAALVFAGITNNDTGLITQGLASLRDPLLVLYAQIGGGPFYIFGVSDWSGNHLSLVGTLSLQWLLNQTEDAELRDQWLQASGEAWQVLRTLEHPVHAALAAGLGVLDNPADQEEATSQALWGLRAFSFPKHSYPVDHRIRGDFVLSPFPSLPWKLDWETDPGRMQSLTGHGLVESVVDDYFWNGSVFSLADGAVGPGQSPGVDYLFLYWLARDLNLIGPGE